MHYEVEQKFPIANMADVEVKLMALGATFGPAVEQIDRYFRHPGRDFAKTDEALRLRQSGDENFITYKGPKIDSATKTRRELELPLSPGAKTIDQFSELLIALGFSLVAAVVKRRRHATIVWQQSKVECALDHVRDAGSFLELEISADEASLENARTSLAKLASHLGLFASERRSYLELILAEKGDVAASRFQ